MILFITLGNITAPIVAFMTLFGFAGWFLGDPSLFNLHDIFTLVFRFLYTAGFIFMGIITLFKHKLAKETGYLVLSAFTVGLVLAISNSYALFRAFTNRKLHWYCTPKVENEGALKAE